MACAVSEQIQTASKPYILILRVVQYFYIPASNITIQLLVFCCDTALESDFLTI